MSGKRIGYVRVSSVDQNPDRQLEGIPLDKKFIDFCSGKTINRPQLNSLIEYARDDDIIFVHSMDRLARNVKDLRNIVDSFVRQGIKIQFVKENLTFSGEDSPISNLLFMVIGSVAEFERDVIRERQAEGIAQAKKRGIYKGRKSKFTSLVEEKIKEKMKTREPKTKIANEVGISLPVLYKYLKIIQEKEEKKCLSA